MILRIMCTKTYYILSSQCNHHPVCSISAKGIMHAWHSHKMRTCLCACVMFVTKITSVYILIKYLCEKGQVYIMICNHSLIIVTIIIYRCLIWLLIPQLLDGYDYICSQCHIIYMIFYGTYTTIASTCACTWLH